MNLTDLKGMSPTEARLYTIEARLRNEENKRIQSIDKVQQKLASIKPSFRRLRSVVDRPRTTVPDPVQTPSTLGTVGLDLEYRSVQSPGGMPSPYHRRYRGRSVKSDLSVHSIPCTFHTVSLINPLDHTGSSQKEMMNIYREFTPVIYTNRSNALGKDTLEKPKKVTLASRIVTDMEARSVEGSPMRYLSLQQHETVEFEPIGEGTRF